MRTLLFFICPLFASGQVSWIGAAAKFPIKKTTIDIMVQTRGSSLVVGEIGATRKLMKNIKLRLVYRKYFPENRRAAMDLKVSFPGRWFNSYRFRLQYLFGGTPTARHRWTTGVKLGAFSPFLSHEASYNLTDGRYSRYRIMSGLNVKFGGAVLGLFYGFQLDEINTHIIGTMLYFK